MFQYCEICSSISLDLGYSKKNTQNDLNNIFADKSKRILNAMEKCLEIFR